ncbi:hypothetical protein [Sphingomicrobium arenosum]|uniref:hypothetical protein n=1 Tax=Sphingomicrobium arenosum TaxID=2233861 RepID=UPI00223F00FF|nr:hypothetical protein [Sphingomicrobium arenosum]
MSSAGQRAQKTLWVAHIGGAGMLALIAAQLFGAPEFVRGFFTGLMLVIVLVLLIRRRDDEYLARLWNAGAATAFTVTVVLTFYVGPIRGFIDGLRGVYDPTPPLSADAVGLTALFAFFLAFHLELLRDRP